MPEITHSLVAKASLIDGTVPASQLPAAMNFGSTRFAVSLSPQAIIQAPAGNRPPDWADSDCDPPVLSLLANVTPRWSGYFGALNPSSIPNTHVQVQAGLKIAYADTNKVGISASLQNPVNVNMSNAINGQHFIYAEFDSEGKYTLFGYSSSDSSKRVIQLPSFSGYTLSGWGTISASSFNSTDYPWMAFDRSNTNSWNSGTTLPATLTCALTKPRWFSGYKMHVNASLYYPKRWEVYGDSILLDTQISSAVLVNGTVSVTFTQPVLCTTITVKILESTSSSVRVSEFTPVFKAEAWYDNASKTMFNASGEAIRRTYIGYVIVANGLITNCHSYSLGSETYVPINSGNNIYEGQYIVEPKPYPDYKGIGEIWSAKDNEWYRTDQSLYSLSTDNNSLAIAIDDHTTGLVVVTAQLLSGIASAKDIKWYFESISRVGSIIQTFGRVRVSKIV